MPENRDKYFKGQQEHEEFICFFRRHWITIFKEIMYFSIFLGMVILTLINIGLIKDILIGNRELKMLFLIAFLGMTFFMHRCFLNILNHFLQVGIITNSRIIDHKKTLYFSSSMESILIDQIQDVERIGEGILPNIFNYGDIKIYLTGTSAVKTFKKMPNARFHFRCINRLVEERKKAMLTERLAHGIKETHNPYQSFETALEDLTKIPVER